MRVNLPGTLELTCPDCQAAFTCSVKHLHTKAQVACPFCESDFDIYRGLSGRLKRKVYQTMRDELLHRVYLEKTKDLPPEVREWSSRLPAGSEDSQSQ